MSTEETILDPQDRVCCPDDLCTGILNEKGTCGTCDRTYSQYARALRAEAPDAADQPAIGTVDADSPAENSDDERVSDGDNSDPHDASVNSDHEEDSDDPAATDAPDPTERVLCSNDMCTGIIGPNGLCGTCGTALN